MIYVGSSIFVLAAAPRAASKDKVFRDGTVGALLLLLLLLLRLHGWDELCSTSATRRGTKGTAEDSHGATWDHPSCRRVLLVSRR